MTICTVMLKGRAGLKKKLYIYGFVSSSYLTKMVPQHHTLIPYTLSILLFSCSNPVRLTAWLSLPTTTTKSPLTAPSACAAVTGRDDLGSPVWCLCTKDKSQSSNTTGLCVCV